MLWKFRAQINQAICHFLPAKGAPKMLGLLTPFGKGRESHSLQRLTGGRVITGRYRITEEYIYFDAGLVSTKSEQVPLWAVRDVDVKQSITQKARKVGDVVVRVQHDDYTGRSQVALESIEDPRSVRDLINTRAQPARLEHQRRAQTHIYQGGVPAGQPVMQPPVASAPAPIAGSASVVTELRELAELHDQGILTDEEFQAEKAKLLNR